MVAELQGLAFRGDEAREDWLSRRYDDKMEEIRDNRRRSLIREVTEMTAERDRWVAERDAKIAELESQVPEREREMLAATQEVNKLRAEVDEARDRGDSGEEATLAKRLADTRSASLTITRFVYTKTRDHLIVLKKERLEDRISQLEERVQSLNMTIGMADDEVDEAAETELRRVQDDIRTAEQEKNNLPSFGDEGVELMASRYAIIEGMEEREELLERRLERIDADMRIDPGEVRRRVELEMYRADEALAEWLRKRWVHTATDVMNVILIVVEGMAGGVRDMWYDWLRTHHRDVYEAFRDDSGIIDPRTYVRIVTTWVDLRSESEEGYTAMQKVMDSLAIVSYEVKQFHRLDQFFAALAMGDTPRQLWLPEEYSAIRAGVRQMGRFWELMAEQIRDDAEREATIAAFLRDMGQALVNRDRTSNDVPEDPVTVHSLSAIAGVHPWLKAADVRRRTPAAGIWLTDPGTREWLESRPDWDHSDGDSQALAIRTAADYWSSMSSAIFAAYIRSEPRMYRDGGSLFFLKRFAQNYLRFAGAQALVEEERGRRVENEQVADALDETTVSVFGEFQERYNSLLTRSDHLSASLLQRDGNAFWGPDVATAGMFNRAWRKAFSDMRASRAEIGRWMQILVVLMTQPTERAVREYNSIDPAWVLGDGVMTMRYWLAVLELTIVVAQYHAVMRSEWNIDDDPAARAYRLKTLKTSYRATKKDKKERLLLPPGARKTVVAYRMALIVFSERLKEGNLVEYVTESDTEDVVRDVIRSFDAPGTIIMYPKAQNTPELALLVAGMRTWTSAVIQRVRNRRRLATAIQKLEDYRNTTGVAVRIYVGPDQDMIAANHLSLTGGSRLVDILERKTADVAAAVRDYMVVVEGKAVTSPVTFKQVHGFFEKSEEILVAQINQATARREREAERGEIVDIMEHDPPSLSRFVNLWTRRYDAISDWTPKAGPLRGNPVLFAPAILYWLQRYQQLDQPATQRASFSLLMANSLNSAAMVHPAKRTPEHSPTDPLWWWIHHDRDTVPLSKMFDDTTPTHIRAFPDAGVEVSGENWDGDLVTASVDQLDSAVRLYLASKLAASLFSTPSITEYRGYAAEAARLKAGDVRNVVGEQMRIQPPPALALNDDRGAWPALLDSSNPIYLRGILALDLIQRNPLHYNIPSVWGDPAHLVVAINNIAASPTVHVLVPSRPSDTPVARGESSNPAKELIPEPEPEPLELMMEDMSLLGEDSIFDTGVDEEEEEFVLGTRVGWDPIQEVDDEALATASETEVVLSDAQKATLRPYVHAPLDDLPSVDALIAMNDDVIEVGMVSDREASEFGEFFEVAAPFVTDILDTLGGARKFYESLGASYTGTAMSRQQHIQAVRRAMAASGEKIASIRPLQMFSAVIVEKSYSAGAREASEQVISRLYGSTLRDRAIAFTSAVQAISDKLGNLFQDLRGHYIDLRRFALMWLMLTPAERSLRRELQIVRHAVYRTGASWRTWGVLSTFLIYPTRLPVAVIEDVKTTFLAHMPHETIVALVAETRMYQPVDRARGDRTRLADVLLHIDRLADVYRQRLDMVPRWAPGPGRGKTPYLPWSTVEVPGGMTLPEGPLDRDRLYRYIYSMEMGRMVSPSMSSTRQVRKLTVFAQVMREEVERARVETEDDAAIPGNTLGDVLEDIGRSIMIIRDARNGGVLGENDLPNPGHMGAQMYSNWVRPPMASQNAVVPVLSSPERPPNEGERFQWYALRWITSDPTALERFDVSAKLQDVQLYFRNLALRESQRPTGGQSGPADEFSRQIAALSQFVLESEASRQRVPGLYWFTSYIPEWFVVRYDTDPWERFVGAFYGIDLDRAAAMQPSTRDVFRRAVQDEMEWGRQMDRSEMYYSGFTMRQFPFKAVFEAVRWFALTAVGFNLDELEPGAARTMARSVQQAYAVDPRANVQQLSLHWTTSSLPRIQTTWRTAVAEERRAISTLLNTWNYVGVGRDPEGVQQIKRWMPVASPGGEYNFDEVLGAIWTACSDLYMRAVTAALAKIPEAAPGGIRGAATAADIARDRLDRISRLSRRLRELAELFFRVPEFTRDPLEKRYLIPDTSTGTRLGRVQLRNKVVVPPIDPFVWTLAVEAYFLDPRVAASHLVCATITGDRYWHGLTFGDPDALTSIVEQYAHWLGNIERPTGSHYQWNAAYYLAMQYTTMYLRTSSARLADPDAAIDPDLRRVLDLVHQERFRAANAFKVGIELGGIGDFQRQFEGERRRLTWLVAGRLIWEMAQDELADRLGILGHLQNLPQLQEMHKQWVADDATREEFQPFHTDGRTTITGNVVMATPEDADVQNVGADRELVDTPNNMPSSPWTTRYSAHLPFLNLPLTPLSPTVQSMPMTSMSIDGDLNVGLWSIMQQLRIVPQIKRVSSFFRYKPWLVDMLTNLDIPRAEPVGEPGDPTLVVDIDDDYIAVDGRQYTMDEWLMPLVGSPSPFALYTYGNQRYLATVVGRIAVRNGVYYGLSDIRFAVRVRDFNLERIRRIVRGGDVDNKVRRLIGAAPIATDEEYNEMFGSNPQRHKIVPSPHERVFVSNSRVLRDIPAFWNTSGERGRKIKARLLAIANSTGFVLNYVPNKDVDLGQPNSIVGWWMLEYSWDMWIYSQMRTRIQIRMRLGSSNTPQYRYLGASAIAPQVVSTEMFESPRLGSRGIGRFIHVSFLHITNILDSPALREERKWRRVGKSGVEVDRDVVEMRFEITFRDRPAFSIALPYNLEGQFERTVVRKGRLRLHLHQASEVETDGTTWRGFPQDGDVLKTWQPTLRVDTRTDYNASQTVMSAKEFDFQRIQLSFPSVLLFSAMQ